MNSRDFYILQHLCYFNLYICNVNKKYYGMSLTTQMKITFLFFFVEDSWHLISCFENHNHKKSTGDLTHPGLN